MRVFITGGTGFLGGAIVRALTKSGHHVSGLVRSAEKEAELRALGGVPVRGDMKDTRALAAAAAGHDALVHAAFEYGPEGAARDRSTVEALLAAAQGGAKAFVYTSGVLVLGLTGDAPADENASTAKAIPMVQWRPPIEKLTLDRASPSLAAVVIRPGFVYGATKGLVAGYFESATKEGAAAYVGDGSNHMAFVHRDDLGQLYRLVLEKGARGVFHGVDGGAARIAEVARAASEAAGKGGAVKSVPVEQARQKMGPFADALCADQIVTTRRAAEVGWKPAHPPLPAGLREAFAEWQAARA
ncbi:MAG: NAD-dependent epimerase/dehydratase family protein [Myxococcales bacterium]